MSMKILENTYKTQDIIKMQDMEPGQLAVTIDKDYRVFCVGYADEKLFLILNDHDTQNCFMNSCPLKVSLLPPGSTIDVRFTQNIEK